MKEDALYIIKNVLEDLQPSNFMPKMRSYISRKKFIHYICWQSFLGYDLSFY